MTDADVLSDLDAAFAACKRPEHFTDYRHCCECAEHDDTLRARDRENRRLEDVGNPGRDPLCFTSAEGLLYDLPARARPTRDLDWYAVQLHFHLTYNGSENRILRAASPGQRRAVVRLLDRLVATRAESCDTWSCRADLVAAAELWRERTSD